MTTRDSSRGVVRRVGSPATAVNNDLLLVVYMHCEDRRRLFNGSSYWATKRDEKHTIRVASVVLRRFMLYPRKFTSVNVFVGHIPRGAASAAYGCVAATLRLESVIDSVFVVAEGDCRDAALNRPNRLVPVRKCWTGERKRKTLRDAAEKTKVPRYCEARISRSLVESDILTFDGGGCFPPCE